MSSSQLPWSAYRQPVLAAVDTYLETEKVRFPLTEPWPSDIVPRLQTFIYGGKTVRGALVGWMSALLAGQAVSGAAEIGAAIELLHASMMIHDDIIDQDDQRHGQPTIVKQYQDVAQHHSFRQPRHYGESLALCVGDLSLFWANDLLVQDSLTADQQRALLRLVNHNMIATGLAEIMDTDAGFDATQLSEVTATTISTYKTARYTFCLPFGVAAILTDQPASVRQTLDQLGELIGLIYQTRDDELGLFGQADQMGKAVGADVRERKKTLYLTKLFARLSATEQAKLRHLIGADTITDSEAEWVVSQVEALGVRAEIDQQLSQWQVEAMELVTKLPISDPDQQSLHQLVKFIRQRQK